jgi:hypothetical protein
MNIISQMRNKILELSNFHNTEQVEDRFAERILKLKVLSKVTSCIRIRKKFNINVFFRSFCRF